MHNKLPAYFTFINSFKEEYIRKLDKKIAIIYRNYEVEYDEKLILNIKETCKKYKKKFFLSNNLKLAVNLNLDGVYLPSFNKTLNFNKESFKKEFLIIGSAHSIKEIRIKEKQGAALIFLSPLFQTKKNKQFLNPLRFNLLASKTKKKIIALGGITHLNYQKLNLVNSYGFAGISYFEKGGRIKI
tara:strand:+ start:35 stop:589 length:555 start_codon:yes stop_codon:yes gene_type:complete